MGQRQLLGAPAGGAKFSECGKYRYKLWRRFGPGNAPPLLFVMLNPSTADASVPDPTITRCIGIAQREKAGGLIVLNLFAYKATDPKALPDNQEAAFGPLNKEYLESGLRHAQENGIKVVCAWGAHARAKPIGAQFVERFAAGLCLPLWCIALNKGGSPLHPLYSKLDKGLEPYGEPA